MAAGITGTKPCSAAKQGGKGTPRPNLVFIVVDDLGWGGFGPNNNAYDSTALNREFIDVYPPDYTMAQAFDAAARATPTLSELSARGTRFTSAYAVANVSSPSRAGMLTACHQQRFGYYINEEQSVGIPQSVKLMPQVLHEAGYATACIGKWHVGPETARAKGDCAEGHHPLDRGFDYYFGFNNSTSKYYDSQVLYRGRENVKADGYLTDELTREAVGFIHRTAPTGKPFAIYLAYNAVHGPLSAPAPAVYRARFNSGSPMLDNYYVYLFAVDEGVRLVCDELRRTGQADRTMIVFVSDNGAPGTKIDVLPKNGPWRGFKGQTWQGAVRVPMFAFMPGGKAGVCDQIVSGIDIFPTFMDLAGVALPEGQVVDGRSLLPILKGDKKFTVRDHFVWMGQNAGCWGIYREKDQMTAPGGFMVREGDWTLRYDTQLKTFSLYDLRTDRGEQDDLAGKYPEKVTYMAGLFRRWYAQMPQPAVWKQQFWGGVEYWNADRSRTDYINSDK
ncbi:MAG: sulfatase-like hydrolase/transferase [Rikenellaceae bacterium]|nr:sulfatase-like hydrolase/transferase [Rikenellaceae bacterium]